MCKETGRAKAIVRTFGANIIPHDTENVGVLIFARFPIDEIFYNIGLISGIVDTYKRHRYSMYAEVSFMFDVKEVVKNVCALIRDSVVFNQDESILVEWKDKASDTILRQYM